MKIIFMGTPDFAEQILDALYQAGHEIVLAVTQPDKPRGRKGALTAPEVKKYAIEHQIPVFQPKRIREEAAMEELQKYPCDLAVVAAFGQILPERVLKMPRLGCVNVHASLLPKYRGAAPIQWAVLNGDEETGISTMQMGVGLDDGDILEQAKLRLNPWETGASLFDRLALLGRQLIISTLEGLEAGSLTPRAQEESQASHVGMIQKDMGRLDFTRSAQALERMVRGLNSWPSAFTSYQGSVIKIWRAGVLEEEQEVASDPRDALLEEGAAPAAISTLGAQSFQPGQVFALTEDAIYIKCGQGILRLEEIQKAGKRSMPVSDFLRGHKVAVGDIFGI